MPILRCQARFQAYTNVPEDVYTNTLHFVADPPYDMEAAAAWLAPKVNSFYQAVYNGSLASPVFAPSGHTQVWYDLSQPKPRVPIFTDALSNPSQGSANGLPEEVSICLSFQGPTESGVNQARRRGRIYLGPFASPAIALGTDTVFSSVPSSVRNQIATAAKTHLFNTEDIGLHWVVYSPTAQTTTNVTNGWIDASLDTQRRRGSRIQARTTWTTP